VWVAQDPGDQNQKGEEMSRSFKWFVLAWMFYVTLAFSLESIAIAFLFTLSVGAWVGKEKK